MKRVKKIFVLFLLLIPIITITAQKSEQYYQDYYVSVFGGRTGVVLDSGLKPDIVTERYVIEVDFCHKYEYLGQVLLYANETVKIPAVLLILQGKKDYRKYIERVLTLYKYTPFTVWLIDENLNIILLIEYEERSEKK